MPTGQYRSTIMQAGLVSLLAFAAAFSWNYWNLTVMRQLPDADDRLRHGWTIATSDDASYLRPVEEFLGHRTADPQVPIVRSPGYGIWYLLLRIAFPEEKTFLLLVIWQTLLFACSVSFLWYTLRSFDLPVTIRWAIILLIGLMPSFHGFLFYTLTESVTPAYLLICTCSALCHWRTSDRKWLIIGGITWALLLLTRPILGWGGLPLLLSAYHHHGPALSIMLMVIALVPLLAWMAMESSRSGYIISPHPVYHPGSTGLFRPTHRAFWDLAKSWGMKGDRFHTIMEKGFQQGLNCGLSDSTIIAFISTAPEGHLNSSQIGSIYTAFGKWGEFTCTTHAKIIQGGSAFEPRTYAVEEEIISLLHRVKDQYRRDHPLFHHVIVPAMVMKDMMVHSNLNLYMFQHSFRGRIWMELLRWSSLGIHVLLFTLPWIALFLPLPSPLKALAIMMVLYILTLAYVQRGIEERYTLPVLHGILLLLPFMIGPLRNYFRRKEPIFGTTRIG